MNISDGKRVLDEYPGDANRQADVIGLDEYMAYDSSNTRSEGQTAPMIEIWSRLQAQDMLVPGSVLGQEVFDQYRRIKRPLISNAFGKTSSLVDGGNLILVTSSVPGEGKTYTSVNLAIAMAQEKDSTVLLVDGDVNKQGVSRMLGIENRPGLIDVLSKDTMSMADVLLKTDIPGLSVIPAGQTHAYVTELLASNRMEALIEELSRRYADRLILIDAPPLLPTPQTQVVARLAGQIVFVIEAGKTSRFLIDEALAMIPEEKPVGLVLNKREGSWGGGGYYKNYYGLYTDGKT